MIRHRDICILILLICINLNISMEYIYKIKLWQQLCNNYIFSKYEVKRAPPCFHIVEFKILFTYNIITYMRTCARTHTTLSD